MKIVLNTPRGFSEQGMKSNQEDRVMPRPIEKIPKTTRCFVLCDGMGGHEHGEVAADIVSQSLYNALMAGVTTPDIITPERFKEALAVAYNALDQMPIGEGKRPGTTMTCVYLAENGVLVAHIGDSRIYQVRPGQGIIFKTRDHSLVNDLLRAGELTEEEAETFPQKNVITRAMQPKLERPYRADIKILTDVRPGDYFFMCCDGILEQLSDEQLVEIVEGPDDPAVKREKIFDICFNRTRDNFTCILIPVESVEGEPLPTPEPPKAEEPLTAVVEIPDAGHEQATKSSTLKSASKSLNARAERHRRAIIIGSIVFIVLVALCLCFFLLKPDKAEQKDEKPSKPQEIHNVKVEKQEGKNNVQQLDEPPKNPQAGPSDQYDEETRMQLEAESYELIDDDIESSSPERATRSESKLKDEEVKQGLKPENFADPRFMRVLEEAQKDAQKISVNKPSKK